MIDADAGWTPLYLSTIAGMSTCLGAAVVFCHPVTYDDGSKHARRNVSAGTMCFSLALAGSVMVTVSVISIGPECLADPASDGRWMPVWSWPFAQRALSFGLGWMLYVLLSKCAFPEPEDIIEASLLADAPPPAPKVAAAGAPPPRDGGGGAKRGGDGAAESAVDAEGGDVESPSYPSEATDHITPSPTKDPSRGRSTGKVRGRRVKRADSSDSVLSAASDLDTEAAASAPLLEREDSKKDKNMASSSGGAAASVMTSMESFTSFASGDDLGTRDQRRAWRVSMLLFVSLLCHNFPEGLAVCASALESDRLGLTVTVGIMIHNIPEGIAIAIPCLAARPDYPWLSFLLASFSGLAEPFGAFVALIVLRRLPVGGAKEGGEDPDAGSMLSLENVLAFVAGIMIAVSICELFPEARRHIPEAGKMQYYTGTLCGIIVMVATELYLPS